MIEQYIIACKLHIGCREIQTSIYHLSHKVLTIQLEGKELPHSLGCHVEDDSQVLLFWAPVSTCLRYLHLDIPQAPQLLVTKTENSVLYLTDLLLILRITYHPELQVKHHGWCPSFLYNLQPSHLNSHHMNFKISGMSHQSGLLSIPTDWLWSSPVIACMTKTKSELDLLASTPPF